MSNLGILLQLHRKRWRDHQGILPRLTQELLSEWLNRKASTYGQWERNRGKPTRQDLLALISIFCKGGALEALEEANRLLQAGDYRGLNDTEIRELKPEWLPSKNFISDVGLIRTIENVYTTFPTEVFKRKILDSDRIQILNTWIPNLDLFVDELTYALRNGASLQILLLHPNSTLAEARNEALQNTSRPIPPNSVQQGVLRNLEVLEFIAQCVENIQQTQLQIRIYNSLPSISIYQVDDFCLMGFFFHGRLAISSPQLSVPSDSFLKQRIIEEFEMLWDIGDPLQNIKDL